MPYDLWQVVQCYKESRKIAIIQKFMKHLKGKMAKNEVLPEIVKSCIYNCHDGPYVGRERQVLAECKLKNCVEKRTITSLQYT